MNQIIADLSGLLGLAESLAWATALAFVRIGAVVALMPGFGDPAVPQRIKLALVVCLTLVV
ncbi:MAG: flagellar biosynthesis protein FliR, partial [Rhodobacter sp.]|nr:flagellar biosynthesis protein FliR [Rhodobacter sp.]